MAVQIIKDDEGKAQYAVIPYDEYFQMCLQLAELDDETEADLEDIAVEHDIYDNVMLPGDVCDIMDKESQPAGGWRILRGLSQQEVANKLGISQSAVSQLEAIDSRPQKRTREKLAAIYGCTQSRSACICRKRVNSTSRRLYRRSARPDVRGKTLHRSSAFVPDGSRGCAPRSCRNPGRRSSFSPPGLNIFRLSKGYQTFSTPIIAPFSQRRAITSWLSGRVSPGSPGYQHQQASPGKGSLSPSVCPLSAPPARS